MFDAKRFSELTTTIRKEGESRGEAATRAMQMIYREVQEKTDASEVPDVR